MCPRVLDVPFSYLQFLGKKYFLCDGGAQYNMAKGTSGLPFTQQYIGTIPYWYQIKQLSLFGLGLPLGIVTWLSLAFSLFISAKYRNRGDVLILSWLLPYFILTGNMQVKFLRYLLPMSPLLMIICARVLFWTQGDSRVFKDTHGCSRVFRGAQGYSSVLRGTQGYSRVLRGTQGYSRVLRGTQGRALIHI